MFEYGAGVMAEKRAKPGDDLASQLDARPVSAFDDGPAERVGAILNSTTSLTRDDVLTVLDESDQGFADAFGDGVTGCGEVTAGPIDAQ